MNIWNQMESFAEKPSAEEVRALAMTLQNAIPKGTRICTLLSALAVMASTNIRMIGYKRD